MVLSKSVQTMLSLTRCLVLALLSVLPLHRGFAQSDGSSAAPQGELPENEVVGGIVLGAPQWASMALVIFFGLACLIIWSTFRMRGGNGLRVSSAGLKLIAVAIVCLCLVKPMRLGERARPQENVVAIVLDNSQSMQLKAPETPNDRLEQMKGDVRDDQAWKIRLQQDFDVRTYQFGRRLQKIDDSDSVNATETASTLLTSLDQLRDRLQRRPLAGVLLFSDGNLTDGESNALDLDRYPAPIYPVINDDEPDFCDLCIDTISVQQTDFESSPTKIRVDYHASGLSGQELTVQLMDLQTGSIIEEVKKTIGSSYDEDEVQFRFRPESSGVSFYEVLAFTEADREVLLNPTVEGMENATEATLLNNAQIVSVNRKSGPYRILYLSGRPNWEYKFLRRAIQSDAEVQMVGLIRIAKKEPKFSFRDRSVTSTNPLFAGLGNEEEDAAEQYDEPVLIRLGVKESEELSAGFPDSEEELFAYHAVILDDIESDFFTQDQMLLLRKFVSARGGGLMLLGGQEAFAEEAMRETPLGELAPIYGAPSGGDPKPPGPYRIELTQEGMLQPWLRLSDNEQGENQSVRARPIFRTLNLGGQIKPGASILAYAETGGQDRLPALISQRFGRGRAAAWLVGDLWKSAMRRESSDDDSGGQAWRQMARWLVNDAPRRVELDALLSPDPNEPVTISTTVLDDSYLPMDNAVVKVTVTPFGGESVELEAEMDDEASGVYNTEYWSQEGTAFHANASVESISGEYIGTADVGWTQNVGADEFRQLEINRDRLEEIARRTGGHLVRRNELDQFSRELPNQKVPIRQKWLYPLWHSPWVLTLAIACLSLEWTLRRMKGHA